MIGSAESTYYFSVQELLYLPDMRDSCLLAGRSGLERLVMGVNLSENPSYYNWIGEGEIVITTGYALHQDPAALAACIPLLYEKGASALCLKPAKYLGWVPEEMLWEADRLGLPLIELPERVSFGEFIRLVSDELLRRQTALLRSCFAVSEMLVHTILEGASLQEIAGMVAQLSGCSVLIVDIINDRRVHSLIRRDQERLAGLPLDAVCQALMETAQIHELRVKGHSFGFLYLYGDSLEDPMDPRILAQVLQTIPLEISRRQALDEVERQEVTKFLIHLVSDAIEDEEWEGRRARHLGIDLSGRQLALHIRTDPREEESEREDLWAFQQTMLKAGLTVQFESAGLAARTVAMPPVTMVYLASQGNGEALDRFVERLPGVVGQLAAQFPQMRLSIGAGRPYPGIAGLIRSHREAGEALKSAQRGHRKLVRFQDMGILRMIYADDSNREIQDFIQETMGGILACAPQKRGELIRTLEGYFDHQGNIKRISEVTFAHYNTVAYRIKTIQELTGHDLRNPEIRFRLELGLRLYRLTQGQEQE